MDFLFLADIPLPRPSVPRGSFPGAPVLAFALTVLIEWPMLACWSRVGLRKTAAFALLMNGLTWGTAMGILALWPVPVPALEAGIVAVEAALLVAWWRWSWGKALLISLGLNLASWLVGQELLMLWLTR